MSDSIPSSSQFAASGSNAKSLASPAVATPVSSSQAAGAQPVDQCMAPVAPPNSIGAGHLIKKLSVDLLKTYNTINQRYYAKRKQAQQKKRSSGGGDAATTNNGHDDEHSDYIVKPQEVLNNRYTVLSVIGKGSFGRVVKAYDNLKQEYVAVKIVKSKRAFRKQAQIEIEILTALHNGDPHDLYNIVRMKDTFIHENHQCIAFELLSYNLYELLRDTKFNGVSLNLVRKFAKQLLHTLDFTSRHCGGIIHCDLKPENILLRNSRHSAIKVIDFGSACFHDKKMYTYIQSRFYRAPEVLLGCSYSCAIDMWSLGCILVEMHTGKPLFDGPNAAEQVVRQYEVLGMPPVHMLESGRKSVEYFVKLPDNTWRVKNPPAPSRIADGRRTLRHILGVDTRGPQGARANEKTGHTLRDYLRFEELVLCMLQYDPKHRILPSEALNHKFFQDDAATPSSSVPSSSTVAASRQSVNLGLYGGSSQASAAAVAPSNNSDASEIKTAAPMSSSSTSVATPQRVVGTTGLPTSSSGKISASTSAHNVRSTSSADSNQRYAVSQL